MKVKAQEERIEQVRQAWDAIRKRGHGSCWSSPSSADFRALTTSSSLHSTVFVGVMAQDEEIEAHAMHPVHAHDRAPSHLDQC